MNSIFDTQCKLPEWMDRQMNMENKSYPDSGWAYAVMDHAVALGKWDKDEKTVSFHPSVGFKWDFLQELRLFNLSQELRMLWSKRDDLVFQSRFLQDAVPFPSQLVNDVPKKIQNLANANYMYDNCNLLFGSIPRSEHRMQKYEQSNQSGEPWCYTSADRGGVLYLPWPKKTSDTQFWIGIRNYLSIQSPMPIAMDMELEEFVRIDSLNGWYTSDNLLFTDYRLAGFYRRTRDEFEEVNTYA